LECRESEEPSKSTTPSPVEREAPGGQDRISPAELEPYRQILIANLGPLKLFTLKPNAVWEPAGAVYLRDVYVAPRAKEGVSCGAETEASNNAVDENTGEYPLPSIRPLEEIVASQKRLVIAGGPGLGKSFLLEKLALDWAQGLSPAIPFLIDLPKFDGDRSCPRNFLEYLETGTTVRFNVPRGAAKRFLREQETVVMFDGLDRVFPEQARSRLVDAIINFAYGHASSRVIITTRPEGYATVPQILEALKLAEFHNVTLQEFDGTQIGEYIRRWYGATNRHNESEQRELALRLHLALDGSKSLRKLAGNPLLVTLMLLLSPNKRRHSHF
jgi:predicted NACHT family NTPase